MVLTFWPKSTSHTSFSSWRWPLPDPLCGVMGRGALLGHLQHPINLGPMGSGDCRCLKLYFDPLYRVWDASTLPLTDPTAKLHHCHCWPQRFFRNNIAGPITGFFTGPIVGAWSGAELIPDLLISATINISYSIIIQYTHAAVLICTTGYY